MENIFKRIANRKFSYSIIKLDTEQKINSFKYTDLLKEEYSILRPEERKPYVNKKTETTKL